MIEDLKIDKAEILQEDEAGLVLDYSGLNPLINKKLFSKVWIDFDGVHDRRYFRLEILFVLVDV